MQTDKYTFQAYIQVAKEDILMDESLVVATGWMANDSPSGLSWNVTFKEWSVSNMALDSKVVKSMYSTAH